MGNCFPRAVPADPMYHAPRPQAMVPAPVRPPAAAAAVAVAVVVAPAAAVQIPAPEDRLLHCPCGSVIRTSSAGQHVTSHKHRAYTEIMQLIQHQHDLKPRASHPPKPHYPRHLLAMMMEREKSCPICLDDFTMETVEMTVCGHVVCHTCRPTLPTCPICRSAL